MYLQFDKYLIIQAFGTNLSKAIKAASFKLNFTDRSPGSTGSSAHPAALAASRCSGSCCAGERQSSDWPKSGPRDDRTGGDPVLEYGNMEGTLMRKMRRKDKIIIINYN